MKKIVVILFALLFMPNIFCSLFEDFRNVIFSPANAAFMNLFIPSHPNPNFIINIESSLNEIDCNEERTREEVITKLLTNINDIVNLCQYTINGIDFATRELPGVDLIGPAERIHTFLTNNFIPRIYAKAGVN